MTTILDGKRISQEIQKGISDEAEKLRAAQKRVPHLTAVLIGENPASRSYINAKVKACGKAGFRSTLIQLPETVSEKELMTKISQLNDNPDVDGFIVQLPLPKHVSEKKITGSILPGKDVDGFHPQNIGKMALNLPCFLPATPFGILLLLERYKIETAGKHCVVLGRSRIVGMPVSILMARNTFPGNCTVTLCHSKTKNLSEICRSADILIAAIGKPEFVTADMVKEGAVVIDVGINRIPSAEIKTGYRLVGDVRFNEVAPKCSFIAPVPGGVGPMTVTALLLNTLKAYQHQQYELARMNE